MFVLDSRCVRIKTAPSAEPQQESYCRRALTPPSATEQPDSPSKATPSLPYPAPLGPRVTPARSGYASTATDTRAHRRHHTSGPGEGEGVQAIHPLWASSASSSSSSASSVSFLLLPTPPPLLFTLPPLPSPIAPLPNTQKDTEKRERKKRKKKTY